MKPSFLNNQDVRMKWTRRRRFVAGMAIGAVMFGAGVVAVKAGPSDPAYDLTRKRVAIYFYADGVAVPAHVTLQDGYPALGGDGTPRPVVWESAVAETSTIVDVTDVAVPVIRAYVIPDDGSPMEKVVYWLRVAAGRE